MKRNPEVDAYITHIAPPAQQPLLKRLRSAIKKALPMATEDFESKMPVYKVGEAWTAGFAARAKCPMLYIMDTALVDEYAARLGKARSGKSCIDLKDSKALPLAELEQIAQEMLSELGKRKAQAKT